MAYQYLAPILLITIASSCSSYQRPEAFEAKMNRFSAKTNSQKHSAKNLSPTFTYFKGVHPQVLHH